MNKRVLLFIAMLVLCGCPTCDIGRLPGHVPGSLPRAWQENRATIVSVLEAQAAFLDGNEQQWTLWIVDSALCRGSRSRLDRRTEEAGRLLRSGSSPLRGRVQIVFCERPLSIIGTREFHEILRLELVP